jgi:hypothetical protein
MRGKLVALWMALSTLGLPQGPPRNPFPVLQGPYLGQKAPGPAPQIFAPGILSTGMYERDMTVTPDGNEIFYGLTIGRITTIMTTRQEKGVWTEPEAASFASDPAFYYLEPCLSADGGTIYFLSNRPPKGQQAKPGWQHQNIWASDRKADTSWGEPYDLGPPVNTDANEFFPSVTRDGTLYFSRSKTGEDKTAIYRARRQGGKFAEPELLPVQVNGDGQPYNACIAPDESFLVACVSGRNDSVTTGMANYYVFFRDNHDTWSAGINLGSTINLPGTGAISPAISGDFKYFFFTASRFQLPAGAAGRLNISRLLELHNGPQNGNADIYWVDAAVIQQLKPR